MAYRQGGRRRLRIEPSEGLHPRTAPGERRTMLDAGRIGSLLLRLFEPEIAAWRGKADLAGVFWGYGVVASSALIVLHATALTPRQVALQQGLIVASALYTAWVLVAIWRCSPRAHPCWGALARWLTVAWALNTGFVLVFLQLELLFRRIGG